MRSGRVRHQRLRGPPDRSPRTAHHEPAPSRAERSVRARALGLFAVLGLVALAPGAHAEPAGRGLRDCRRGTGRELSIHEALDPPSADSPRRRVRVGPSRWRFAALTGEVPLLAWLLLLGVIAWAVAYDTMYAMVDRDDDLHVGVKSTAVLFGDADPRLRGREPGRGARGPRPGRTPGRTRCNLRHRRRARCGPVSLPAAPDSRPRAGRVLQGVPGTTTGSARWSSPASSPTTPGRERLASNRELRPPPSARFANPPSRIHPPAPGQRARRRPGPRSRAACATAAEAMQATAPCPSAEAPRWRGPSSSGARVPCRAGHGRALLNWMFV